MLRSRSTVDPDHLSACTFCLLAYLLGFSAIDQRHMAIQPAKIIEPMVTVHYFNLDIIEFCLPKECYYYTYYCFVICW